MSETGSKNVHVVVGAGQIGPEVARRLVKGGHRVRMVRRSGGGDDVPGVEWARGDITDRAFVDGAFANAAVVYNTANPARYDRWDELLPPLLTSIREGAGRAGARLVQLDNLYMYGRPKNGVLREDTPIEPCSKKGELRARLARELFAAHERGDVEVACGRAGDFFGPGTGRNSTVLGAPFFERLRRGQSAMVFGDPDLPHAYSYSRDVAEGLVVLGREPAAAGKVWHLPVAWNGTTREIVARFAEAAGQKPRLFRLPTWLLRIVGLFMGEAGALAEMIYQWETPYRLDDSAFRAAFGVSATPIDQAVRETLDAMGFAAAPAATGAIASLPR